MEIKKTKTKVTCIKCPKCKDVIYSRTHYDCRSCSCGEVAIDGGFDYTRILGYYEGEPFNLEIDVTEQELYDDWNNRINKYGVIKNV